MDDKYRDIIREKFDDLEGVPPIGGWNSIKDKVQKKPERPSLRFFLLPLIMAAGILLFLGGYFLGNKKGAKNSTSTSANQIQVDAQNPATSQDNDLISMNNGIGDIQNIKPVDLVSANDVINAPVRNSNRNESINNSLNEENDHGADNINEGPVMASNSTTGQNNPVLVVPAMQGADLRNAVNTNDTEIANEANQSGSNESTNESIAFENDGASFNNEQTSESMVNSEESSDFSHVNKDLPTDNIFVTTMPLGDNSKFGSQEVDMTPAAVESDDNDDHNDALAEQIEDDKQDKEPNKKKSKFTFGIYGSAISNYKYVRSGEIKTETIERGRYVSNLSPDKIGYEIGINANRQISNRWTVGLSVEHSQINDRMEYIASGKVEPVSVKQSNLSFNHRTTAAINKSYDIKLYMVGVNANAEYELIKNKLGITGSVGYARMVKGSVMDDYNRPFSSTDYLPASNIKTSIGIAYVRSVNENWDMKIQPVFNYYLNPVIKDRLDSKPFGFGVRLNLITK